jgi:hypothetical protein
MGPHEKLLLNHAECRCCCHTRWIDGQPKYVLGSIVRENMENPREITGGNALFLPPEFEPL